MTTGIYALYWEDPDLIYVGQAQNINSRYAEHLKLLNRVGHTNYKVQSAYNSFGKPQLVILEVCSIPQLNDLEISWQKELDSLHSLDLIYAGQVGHGVHSNASKYTKRQVLKVFSCLYRKAYNSQQIIAKRCRVLPSFVSGVYNGSTHLWLRDTYPSKYFRMKEANYRVTSGYSYGQMGGGRLYPILVAPSGEEFRIEECVLNTARVITSKYYPLDSVEVVRKGISRVLSGIRKSWRGWTATPNIN